MNIDFQSHINNEFGSLINSQLWYCISNFDDGGTLYRHLTITKTQDKLFWQLYDQLNIQLQLELKNYEEIR